MKTCSPFLAALGLSALVFAPIHVGKAEDTPILKSEFIYESGPYPQIHATTIEESPHGLVAAWFGGTHEKSPDVGIWVSRLVDGKWTPSAEVANGVQYTDDKGKVHRHPTWNPVLFQPRKGPLMLFYKVGPDPQTWWGMLTTSNDGGTTWSTPQRLPEGILGPIKNRPVELANGDILCPTSNETDENPSKWSVHFEVTSDQGRTWRKVGPVNDGVAIQAIQPSLLKLGNNKWLAVGRSRQDNVFQTLSEDDGKTWGKIKLGQLPNNNSGTDATTLRDGRHVIVYNHIGGVPGKWGGKRTPLNVAVSEDGYDWKAALILEDEPGEYSYPSIMQSRDGLLHITYTWKRQRVKHVVIDPAKLKLQAFQNGRWPGTENPMLTELLEADKARVTAFLKPDPKALNKWLASNLHYAHSTGVLDSKESLIKSLLDGDTRYIEYNYLDQKFEFPAPGMALMMGKVQLKVSTPKGEAAPVLSYLGIWIKEKEGWKFTAWQSCKLPEQP